MSTHLTPLHVPLSPQGMPRKAALSAWIGSALEYYDFFIYGTAAGLVFNKLFFAGLGDFGGTLASFATLGIAYVVRPIGSFVMGHLGDTRGRRLVMFITIFGMGVATFLVGCLPTYDQAGWLGPILLVVLRLFQGFAVAGEQSGATSMTMEHAPPERRAFFASFTLGGTQFGFILATAVFLAVSALPQDAFFSWGWRVPFWLSAIVVAVAWWIRHNLDETPAFVEETVEEGHAVRADETPKVATSPLSFLGRFYVGDVIKVFFACLVSVTSTIMGTYALTYGSQTMGIPRTTILWSQIFGNLLAVVAIPTWAIIADRIGRRPVFLIGALGSAAMIWPFIYALSQKDVTMLFVATFFINLLYSAYGGAGMSLFSEQFETRVRMSGTAVGTQFGFALGGFAPTIAALLAGPGLHNWVPVAVFTCACGAIAAISSLFMRDGKGKDIHELGNPRALAEFQA